MTRAAVVGAGGFVGSAVARALVAGGHEVVAVRAPRAVARGADPAGLRAQATEIVSSTPGLVDSLRGCAVVVNAAGDPDASSLDRVALQGANALVPAVLLEACRRAAVLRLVHVSSAVVQADVNMLDDAPAGTGFSPYSDSKIAGEAVLDRPGAGPLVVVYRPPSVHGPDRRVSRLTARISRSRIASVAGRGDRPSPQALIDNVGSAVAFLATCEEPPPARVAHPSEGLTTGDVMRLLGAGHEPLHIPTSAAHGVLALARAAGRWLPTLGTNARRLQVLWFGQSQAPSWLTAAGWVAAIGLDGWQALGHDLQRQARG